MSFDTRNLTQTRQQNHRSKFRYASLVMGMGLMLLGGCNYLPTNQPFEPLQYASPTGVPSRNLVVFIRGLGGNHTSFEKQGMVALIQEYDLDYQSTAPNAHFGYYTGRSLIQRLKEDIIDPAKTSGVDNIWLVGVSMGGLGSLLYCTEYPEDISGVYLIAPFLGYHKVSKSIDAAGGLESWDPGPTDLDKNWQPALWKWIKTDVAAGNTPPIYLGYGTEDRYVEGQLALASVLGDPKVIAISGGHKYPTFRELWRLFLESGLLEATPEN